MKFVSNRLESVPRAGPCKNRLFCWVLQRFKRGNAGRLPVESSLTVGVIPTDSNQTDRMKNSTKYKQDFTLLSRSAAGVILTRTREPHRVLAALTELAFENEKPFHQWNFRDGWLCPSTTPDGPPQVEKLLDPYAALKRIKDVDGDGSKAWNNSICAMVWCEKLMGQVPPFDECLRQYARDFTLGDTRLVIIAAEGFILPQNLQHDIPVLDFELPNKEELRECYDTIIEAACGEGNEIVSPYSDKQVDELLSLGGGMTEAEFELSLAKAVTEHRPQWPNITLQKFASVISASKTEIVKRSEVLELMKPVKITDIGGLELLKDWVIKRKSAFTDAARAFGVDIPKGIVLIGPPGTGKSMGAKAISYEFAFPLIRFDVGRVFGSLVGQSESRVRSALKQLEAMAPCIAFLDEVDKAGIDPRQAGGDGGTSKRVMGSILTFMQETTAPVFWILTANRPNSLPPELLRKGRLDEVFSVLPPNRAERKEIIKIHLAKRNQPMIKGAGLEQLLDRSQGYVGAEIEAAIKEAVVDAYNNGGKPVTGEAICEQLACMKPISIAFKEDFDAMAAWASNNARPSSIQTEESKIVRAVVRKGRHLN